MPRMATDCELLEKLQHELLDCTPEQLRQRAAAITARKCTLCGKPAMQRCSIWQVESRRYARFTHTHHGSKCTWCCGAAHQREHWRVHKTTCSGKL